MPCLQSFIVLFNIFKFKISTWIWKILEIFMKSQLFLMMSSPYYFSSFDDFTGFEFIFNRLFVVVASIYGSHVVSARTICHLKASCWKKTPTLIRWGHDHVSLYLNFYFQTSHLSSCWKNEKKTSLKIRQNIKKCADFTFSHVLIHFLLYGRSSKNFISEMASEYSWNKVL